MTPLTRALCATLLLSLSSCDDSYHSPSNLGYTAHLLFESDADYRGDVCVYGSGAIAVGNYPLRFERGSLEGFDVSWRGQDGVLEIVGEHDEAPRGILFTDTLGADFAATPQVRTLEHEVEGHRVVIYAENLGYGSGCEFSQHSRSDYDGTGNGDGGLDNPENPHVATSVPSLLALGGTGRGDVWGAGYNGVVLHYDGQGWTQTVEDAVATFMSLWVSGLGDELWVVALPMDAQLQSAKLLRGRPGAWVEVDPGRLDGEILHQVWGTSPDDVWVTGYIEDSGGGGRAGVVHHLSAGGWTTPASYVGGRLSGIWGPGPNEVIIGGNDGTGSGGYLGYFVNGKFDRNEYPDEWVGCVWGTGPNDVWTAGGTLSHFDGSQWVGAAQLPGRFHQFFDLWGRASNDVWAVGSQGVSNQDYSGIILHWNGSAWSEAPMRPLSEVDAVWGSAADDVWVAARGALYHYDGSTWRLTAPSEIAIAP